VWHNDLMAGQVAQVHKAWFEKYRDLYQPKTAALIERGHQIAPESIKVYQAERQWLAEELRKVMQENGIEVWISPPATGPAHAGLSSTGDPVMNLPWTYAGSPAINLPAGFAKNGLPMGLQITSDCQQDEKLMGWAKPLAAAVAP
jgi:Asp-tRNA(Asn)/Glu-tRNA(Gln) amidotransferase A subunit family amidase